MTLLQASNLAHSFGAADLFQDVTVRINEKDRIGLVGPNGVGKTTLLQILAGRLKARHGNVATSADFTVGYLRQEAVLTFAGHNHTVLEEMRSVFGDLIRSETALRQLEGRMAAGEDDAELLDEYGRLQVQFELGGGYDYMVDIRRVLQGLGLEPAQWEAPLDTLSGGQKTRVLLARLLLARPQLLILDEPTNHLDVAAVEWLERRLRTWPGALLIVSHDRYFLNRVVSQIWDMSRHGLESYRGDYTAYVRQRQEAWAFRQARFEAETARLRDELAWIRRHLAGGQADMARGRLKQLTRELLIIDQHGVLALDNRQWLELGGRTRPLTVSEAEQRLRALRPPADRPPRLNLRLTSEERSSHLVWRAKNLRVGYPGAPLFTTGKVRLERTDCAAVIGPNGSGKTTLLRTLWGEVAPLRGKFHWGDNVTVGYFAQGHEQLAPSRTVLEELLALGDLGEQEARRYLAQALFRGEDVFKKVADLSGGERGRLALAILARTGANCLLLDEPTNHLDIPSQEVVQEVLENFDGAIVLVSHDRYLVDRLATQVWTLRDGGLHVHHGSYADLLAGTASDPASAAAAKAPAPAEPLPPPDMSWVADLAPPQMDRPTPAERPSTAASASWEERLGALDDALLEAEAWRAELTAQRHRAVSEGDEAAAARLQEELAAADGRIQQLAAEWDELIGS